VFTVYLNLYRSFVRTTHCIFLTLDYIVSVKYNPEEVEFIEVIRRIN